MLNAKRIFFIVLSNVGVRLFRLGIYSTSNSQSASAPRVFERAHAQKHASTHGHDSTLIKRERTTDLTLLTPTELAATPRSFAFYVAEPISSRSRIPRIFVGRLCQTPDLTTDCTVSREALWSVKAPWEPRPLRMQRLGALLVWTLNWRLSGKHTKLTEIFRIRKTGT